MSTGSDSAIDRTVRELDLRGLKEGEASQLLRREWLATNGLGGYASGTISGAVTWRYHGLLIAALPGPFGRTVMLNHLTETLRLANQEQYQLSGEELSQSQGASHPVHYLTAFRLENGLPVWRYEVAGVVLEKHVVFLYGQNTVHVSYHLLSRQDNLLLELRPSIHFRGHEYSVNEPLQEDYGLVVRGERYEVRAGPSQPALRLMTAGDHGRFTYDGGSRREIYYQKEAERGYPSRGALWSPGYFSLNLRPGQPATLIASTEPWHSLRALSPEEALGFYHDRHRHLVLCALSPRRRRLASNPAAFPGQSSQTAEAPPVSGVAAKVEPPGLPALPSGPDERLSNPDSPAADLVLAADQFIITPAGRIQHAARAHAAGDEIRTVIAGYHWFTDWGRDTMISLEGLTLTTKRHAEAGWILRTFAHYIRDGLIPNLFPEGRSEGLYHTADATLWFFHALGRYVQMTGDRETLRDLLPKLIDIVEHHLRGTRFGIGVDPKDGLLTQGAPGYQLTWMDAKVDDWVVTPRRGKAVEINGLWFNALRLLEGWLRQEQGDAAAAPFADHASRARESFNRRFWYAAGNYLYDVVDGEAGNDSSCRPNQVLAFSLDHPVLDQQYWKPVLQVVHERLLTPVGLRTLSRDHPDYKPMYFGDLRARDAAYHQGTVWAWLIGPFIDAWLKVHPAEAAGARKFLEGFVSHMSAACVGSISEIFDAEPPFHPRGCIAQAWSVAEVLRCWMKTASV